MEGLIASEFGLDTRVLVRTHGELVIPGWVFHLKVETTQLYFVATQLHFVASAFRRKKLPSSTS